MEARREQKQRQEIKTKRNLPTLSVWLFPRLWIFQITSTLQWVLIISQYIIAHRLHRGQPKQSSIADRPDNEDC